MKKLLPLLLTSSLILSCVALTYKTNQEADQAQHTSTLSQRDALSYEEVIAPQYEDGFIFTNGLAAVKKEGKWGYINTQGEVIIDFTLDHAAPFNEGKALVGKNVISWGETFVAMGIIDVYGNYTTMMITEENEEGNTVSSQFMVALPYGTSSGENYLNISHIFHNGMVSLGEEGDTRLFNTAGQDVFHTYFSVGNYNDGYLYIENENHVYLSRLTAPSQSIPLGGFYDEATHTGICGGIGVNQGLFSAFYSEGEDSPLKLGFLDIETLEWAIYPQYLDFFYGDIYGKEEFFGETGVLMVTKDGVLFGGVNRNNETVIPFEYEELWPYDNGLAPFMKNGKMGYLDQWGNVAIPAQYDRVSGFSSMGLAVAVTNQTPVIIDQKGNVVTGSEHIDASTYLTVNENGYTAYAPQEYVLIRSTAGKVGYGKVSYTPDPPEEGDCSSWAHHLVVEAIAQNLIPISLQNRYTSPITRGDFATLVVHALCTLKGCTIEDLVYYTTGSSIWKHISNYPFLDSSDEHIIAAYSLGIINGEGEGYVSPYNLITRQEAAVMLTAMAEVIGLDTTLNTALALADRELMGNWALNGINYVFQSGIMGTTGNATFSPLEHYTREQAYTTILNLSNNVENSTS